MSDQYTPMTHIDVRVIKNLLISRINEGNELMKSAHVSNDWRRKERQVQERYRNAIKMIDEAIAIKEGNYNENSKAPNQTSEASTEGNSEIRKTGIQNQEAKA